MSDFQGGANASSWLCQGGIHFSRGAGKYPGTNLVDHCGHFKPPLGVFRPLFEIPAKICVGWAKIADFRNFLHLSYRGKVDCRFLSIMKSNGLIAMALIPINNPVRKLYENWLVSVFRFFCLFFFPFLKHLLTVP